MADSFGLMVNREAGSLRFLRISPKRPAEKTLFCSKEQTFRSKGQTRRADEVFCVAVIDERCGKADYSKNSNQIPIRYIVGWRPRSLPHPSLPCLDTDHNVLTADVKAQCVAQRFRQNRSARAIERTVAFPRISARCLRVGSNKRSDKKQQQTLDEKPYVQDNR